VKSGYEKFWFVIASLVLVVGLIRVSRDEHQGWLSSRSASCPCSSTCSWSTRTSPGT